MQNLIFIKQCPTHKKQSKVHISGKNTKQIYYKFVNTSLFLSHPLIKDLKRINLSTIQLAARRHQNSCLLVGRDKALLRNNCTVNVALHKLDELDHVNDVLDIKRWYEKRNNTVSLDARGECKCIITSVLANQRAPKALFPCVV